MQENIVGAVVVSIVFVLQSVFMLLIVQASNGSYYKSKFLPLPFVSHTGSRTFWTSCNTEALKKIVKFSYVLASLAFLIAMLNASLINFSLLFFFSPLFLIAEFLIYRNLLVKYKDVNRQKKFTCLV